MTAGARALRLEQTLLEPSALPPPPTRHALLIIMIALARYELSSGEFFIEGPLKTV